MKNQGQEHGFVAFIMALVVFVMAFVVLPAEAAECENAHKAPCEDLIGAEVTFEQVGIQTLREVCGRGAEACAVLDTKERQCTIYYARRTLSDRVATHELNHCRGWFHRGQQPVTYAHPWVDLNTYLGG